MESCSWPCGGGPCDFGVTPESKSLFLFFFEGLCWFLVGALDSGLTTFTKQNNNSMVNVRHARLRRDDPPGPKCDSDTDFR